MAKPRKNLGGRPSHGLSEISMAMRGPASLFSAAKKMADEQGISISEWWRRAARQRLGLAEVLPAAPDNTDK